jgi:hypothetical protein
MIESKLVGRISFNCDKFYINIYRKILIYCKADNLCIKIVFWRVLAEL